MPDTLDWTAPELLRQGASAASAASDVYALTMTLWEIATFSVELPSRKLAIPEAHSAEQAEEGENAASCAEGEVAVLATPSTRAQILAGWRPSFDGTGMPTQLLHNVELGWGAAPATRPSAQDLHKAVDAYVVGREGGGFSTASRT